MARRLDAARIVNEGFTDAVRTLARAAGPDLIVLGKQVGGILVVVDDQQPQARHGRGALFAIVLEEDHDLRNVPLQHEAAEG